MRRGDTLTVTGKSNDAASICARQEGAGTLDLERETPTGAKAVTGDEIEFQMILGRAIV